MPRKIRSFFCVFFVILFLFPSKIVYGAKQEKDNLGITTISYVLLEGSTGKIICEKNKDKQLMPASITKIMTLLLIFEDLEAKKISLEDTVTVSEHAASMGGSQVWLESNETQTVENMIKCITISSANDACVSMAEYISGSETEFVKRMNEKAAQLGMKNTKFMNCCGLDDDLTEGQHYSTAYDIALMSRELIINYKDIQKYTTKWMDEITHVTKKGEKAFGLTNTNKLVRTYDGITGLKTGSTSKAKYCLSATANRDGMDLIAVVMASPQPLTRFVEAATLLDYGFAICKLYKDENKDILVDTVDVEKGKKEKLQVKVKKGFSYVFLNGENVDLVEKKIEWNPVIKAPIQKKERIGMVVYYYEGNKIGEVPILANEDISCASYLDYLGKTIRKYFNM